MATGLKNSVQITAYIDPHLKERMDRLSASNRRKSLSAQVEEAVEQYLQHEEQSSFRRPTQNARGRHRTV